MCPGDDESAGKRRSGKKTRKGSKWLKERASRSSPRGSAYQGELPLGALRSYQREARLEKKAAVAVGHSILVIAYHLLERKAPYEDLGEDYYYYYYYYVRDRRCSSEAHAKRLVRQLERLGHKVVLEPLVQSA